MNGRVLTCPVVHICSEKGFDVLQKEGSQRAVVQVPLQKAKSGVCPLLGLQVLRRGSKDNPSPFRFCVLCGLRLRTTVKEDGRKVCQPNFFFFFAKMLGIEAKHYLTCV